MIRKHPESATLHQSCPSRYLLVYSRHRVNSHRVWQ